MLEEFILQANDIEKKFPGTYALKKVHFALRKGEVHSLMGENGAGKSTLMNILMGIHRADSGEIKIKGKPVNIHSPREALANGIAMVHQELNPIPYMTVSENIFIGRELRTKFRTLDRKRMNKAAIELFKQISLKLEPNTPVWKLSSAEKQMLEIARAISIGSEILILDEPTSALAEREVSELFKTIKTLTARGMSIIYITHKMDEVFAVTDRVTVLRDGEYVGTKNIREIEKPDLIEMMIGRKITTMFPKKSVKLGKKVLSVRNLTKKGEYRNICFDLHEGEILGLAGLVGSGRTEVAQAIFGLKRLDSGDIFVNGKKIHIDHPSTAIKHGIVMVGEDRKSTDLNLKGSVLKNITLATLKQFIKFIVINGKLETTAAEKVIKLLNIKTPSKDQIVSNLSGGNQQKVIIARWLLSQPRIFILDEPTRGIDVGTKAEIHHIMCQLAQRGCAILMISSEMPEVMGMSDRVIVLHEGDQMGEIQRNDPDFTAAKILFYASGESAKYS